MANQTHILNNHIFTVTKNKQTEVANQFHVLIKNHIFTVTKNANKERWKNKTHILINIFIFYLGSEGEALLKFFKNFINKSFQRTRFTGAW